MTTIDAEVIEGGTAVGRASVIAGQARAVDLGRVGRRIVNGVVWLLVGVLWLIGWLPAQIANGVVFLFLAVRTGWRDARPARPVAQAPASVPDRTVR